IGGIAHHGQRPDLPGGDLLRHAAGGVGGDQLVDNVAVSGVACSDAHLSDQLGVRVQRHVRLVPVKGPGPALVTMTSLGVNGRDHPAPGDLTAIRSPPSSPCSTSWPATNANSSAFSVTNGPSGSPSTAPRAARAPATKASTSFS